MSKKDDEDLLFDEINEAVERRYSEDRDSWRRSYERPKRGQGNVEVTEVAASREAHKRNAQRERAQKKQQLKLAKRKKKLKRLAGFLILIAVFLAFLAFTKPGNKLLLRGASLYAKKTMKEDEENKGEPFKAPDNIPDGWIYDENVVNILLVGIENMGGAAHTDSMILLSDNLKTGKITLVSFLRDTYVDIYGMNKWQKLNYAYFAGGMDTLINTLQNTYKFYINAYAYVDFKSFESIIDELGGVDVELSEKEAQYLNTTNYISDYSNHNLKAGMNHMNGNQALGYCRVRMVATIEGVNNDLGRSLRQRKVLASLFEAYKDQSIIKMVQTANSMLSSVTSSMSSGNIYTLLEAYYDHKTDSLGQLMIPAADLLDPVNVDGVGAVLSIDKFRQENIDLLHRTLYDGVQEHGE